MLLLVNFCPAAASAVAQSPDDFPSTSPSTGELEQAQLRIATGTRRFEGGEDIEKIRSDVLLGRCFSGSTLTWSP
jgi:hypothetical protein